MKVCVLGTGYVGLVVGVCLSDQGHTVCCIDLDQGKIDRLKQGILPIYEPGLSEIVSRNIEAGRLNFSTNGDAEIASAEVIYIAVGTPSASDGSADLRAVKATARQIAKHAPEGSITVIKSTVPVGTADMVRSILKEENAKVLDVVSNPEFLREGAAIEDFANPDRIVVGFEKKEARVQMERLYQSFLTRGHQVYFMDNRSAEITKYASNALLATKISFANELARLCDAAGADIDSVRLGTGSDSRIGHKFLYAGVGYGGSCFPKDVKALIDTADHFGVQLKIARAVEEVNAEQKLILVERIVRDFGDDLAGKSFGIWGLAFKPETDDIREAPALYIIQKLLEKGAKVLAYDPEAIEHTKQIFGDAVDFKESQEDVLKGIDAFLLLTEWKQFRDLDWSLIAKEMKGNHVYDGRNIFDPAKVESAGLIYQGIGRGRITKN